MSTSDAAAQPTEKSGRKSVPHALSHLLTVLFPLLSRPARIAAGILATAFIVATVMAWAGGLGGAGITSGLRPVPIFAALVLTGGTVAAASLPRYTYRWLDRHNWFNGSDGSGFAVVGAHLILVIMQIVLLTVADGPSSTILAGVSAFGALLWFVHEGITARMFRESA